MVQWVQALNLLSAGAVLLLAIPGWRVYRQSETQTERLFALFCGCLVGSYLMWHLVMVLTVGSGFTGTEGQTFALIRSLPPWLFYTHLALAVPGSILRFGWPLLWFLFVLSYTTNIGKTERRGLIGATGVVVSLWLVLAVMGQLSTYGTITLPAFVMGVMYRVVILLGFILLISFTIGGVLQLYRASQDFAPLSRKLVVALSLPPLIGLSIELLFVYFLNNQFAFRMYLELAGMPVAAGGLWLAVTRYDLFETLPASKTVGRDTAIQAASTALVMIDTDGRITDYNAAAATLFNIEPATHIGRQVLEIVPNCDDRAALTSGESLVLEIPGDDRIVEAEAAPITDDGERALGYTISFNDITTERRRQQRIQVMNRVLRHNLRNEGNVITGYADIMTDGGVDVETYASRISEQMTSLIEAGDRARAAEELLATDRVAETPQSLRSIVVDAIDAVDNDLDTEAVSHSIPEELETQANPELLRPIITELVANGLEHTDEPYPSVNVDVRADGTALVVSDNGPGVPTAEIDVIQRGEETQLDHSTGLGLWIIRWGVDRLGGELTFSSTDEGTRVVVDLPPSLLTS